MDMLCSDKTGTLTLNKLTVENSSVFPIGRFSPEQVLLYAALSAQQNSEEAIDLVNTLANTHMHKGEYGQSLQAADKHARSHCLMGQSVQFDCMLP